VSADRRAAGEAAGTSGAPDAPAPDSPTGRPVAVSLIALEKGASAVGLWLLAALALVVHHRARRDPWDLILWRDLGLSAHRAIVRWVAGRLPPVGPRVILALAILLFLWGVLLAAEAIGVWYELGWAELLIILETVLLLPLDAWRALRHPHALTLAALAVNLIVLWYVIVRYQSRLAARAAARSLAQAALGRYPRRPPQRP